jgi:hypothetical protein
MHRSLPARFSKLCLFWFLLCEVLGRRRTLGELDVYRGVWMGEDEIAVYREMIGHLCMWPGFASASRSRGVAERFGNVIFRIHARDRPSVATVSLYGREDEVLFHAHSFFRVEERTNGRTALAMAATLGYSAIVRALLDAARSSGRGWPRRGGSP